MNALRLLVACRLPALVIIIATGWSALRAQSPIYSVNTLGYVDANFVAGSNLIANPLFAVDNTISNLLRDVPNGSSFIPWERGLQQFGTTNRKTGGIWSSPLATLVAPDGGFLVLPSAMKVAFIGRPWSDVGGPGCLTYPSGNSVLSWLPQRCCALDCDVGGPFTGYSDETTIVRWNRQGQTYFDPYTYYEGLGWVPADPTPFAPDEAALFQVSTPFTARGPFLGNFSQGTPLPTQAPSATMVQPQRAGTNFTFRWASASNTSYAVFCSTNLLVVNWRLVDHGAATSVNGVCTVSFGSTNTYAFYRLQPDWAAAPWPVVLPVGHRSSFSSFRFQFYAPTNATYTVERTISLLNPTWSTVTTLSAGPSNIVSVVDGSATDSSRYYRVRY